MFWWNVAYLPHQRTKHGSNVRLPAFQEEADGRRALPQGTRVRAVQQTTLGDIVIRGA